MIKSIRISKRGCRTLGLAALVVACLNSTVVLAQNLGELDCVIEPHVVIDLSSRVDGIVKTMEVERGELIEKGQVLVRLESSLEQAAVAEAKVRAEATAEIDASNISADFAQRRNERIRELYRRQAVSTDQLDEIETQYELSRLQQERAKENRLIAKLELRQAREVLNLHTLRSPIRGIVVQHYLAPGEAVEEQPIMRLAQIDPLRVEVIVPVAAFGTIKVGQRAIMRPESPMEREYSATVTIVDGVADASSGTFRVRLGLSNEDYSLPSGLRCRVRFLPDEQPPATTTSPAAIVAEADQESSKDLVPIKSDPSSYEMVQTGTAVTEVTTENGAQSCQTIGPIADPEQADRIMMTLTGQATQLWLREEGQSPIESYLILAPPQPSSEDSRALIDKMIAVGINDFHVFWRGPHKDRIALGFHRNRTYAEQRQSRLANLGFESELTSQTEARSRYWLDVELLPQINSLDLAGAEQVLGKSNLTTSRCEIVADPDQPKQTLAEASTPR